MASASTMTSTATATIDDTTTVEVPEEVKKLFAARECFNDYSKENVTTDPEKKDLPLIDIFVNPAKKTYLKQLVNHIQSIVKDYFKNSNMTKLYPNLFEILWYSSLPCSHLEGLADEFVMKSCEVAGVKVDCSQLFIKVPTDSGMCCALNSKSALKNSEYVLMIEKMQQSFEFSSNVPKARKRLNLKLE